MQIASRYELFLLIETQETIVFTTFGVISNQEIIVVWPSKQIKKALRGVKVEVTHRGNVRRKYRISGLTSQPTRELMYAYIYLLLCK